MKTLDEITFLFNEFDSGRQSIIAMRDVPISVTREVGKGDYDLIHIRIGEIDIPKWVLRGKPIGSLKKPKKSKGNQTGGCLPFSKTYGKEIRKQFGRKACSGDITSQKAAILDLSEFVEMGTGRLMKGWYNDTHNGKESMTLQDIAQAIGKKERQARTVVKNLIANGFLRKETDGYYLSQKYVSRGRKE